MPKVSGYLLGFWYNTAMIAEQAASLYKKVFFVCLLLLTVGLVVLFSASGVLGAQKYHSEFYYLGRQLLIAVLGLIVLFSLSRISPKVFYQLAYPLFFLQMLAVAATYIERFNHRALGAARWLDLGWFSIQPSEFAKVTVPLYVARLVADSQSKPFTMQTLLIHTSLLLILLAMIFKQPDLGTTAILIVSILGIFYIAGLAWKYIYLLGGSGLVLLTVAIVFYKKKKKRFLAFINPWADPTGSGFQTIQSFISFYSGRILGLGIGNGNSKLFFLPEVHTDFIFCVLGEELGFVGSFIALCLFGYLIYLLLRAVYFSDSLFNRYFTFGLVLSLLLQICVNIGGVTGMIPLKGLTLPFFSWGRTALLTNLIMVGCILAIIRESKPTPKGYR